MDMAYPIAYFKGGKMNLKTYLASVKMTLKQCSEKLDCNPQYLSGIANGKKIPGRRLAKDIENLTNGLVSFSEKKSESRYEMVKEEQEKSSNQQ